MQLGHVVAARTKGVDADALLVRPDVAVALARIGDALHSEAVQAVARWLGDPASRRAMAFDQAPVSAE